MAAAIPASSAPPDTPDRRQRRSAELRDRLFGAALNLFAQKGFAETTVEDITNAADVGKGTFFNYFPSKDHILIAFSDLQVSRLADAVETMHRSHEPMPAFLRALSVRMTAEPARSPDLVRTLLQANLSNSSVRTAMRENHKRAQALLTELMQVGQERGELRNDVTAGEMAYVFRQTIIGTMLIWSVFGDASLSERIDVALKVLWGGMAPRETAPVF